jgi:glycosyltransferase involved in cell wall biosynthesis
MVPGHAPAVSVLIPTYNRATYLKEAVDSVFAQTFKDIEILILDNCSTDNTAEVVAQYGDSRIWYIRNESNVGIIGNHNKALAAARGKYVYIFSDDDVMSDADNLMLKVDVMEKYPNVGLVHGSITMINGAGLHIGGNWAVNHTDWGVVTSKPLMSGATAYEILYNRMNFINMPTVLLRRSLVEQYRIEFNNQIKFLLDWAMWLQMALVGDVYYIDKPQVAYRVHDKNITKSMLQGMYYTEMLSIKIGLASLRGNEFPQVEQNVLLIEKSVKAQLKAFEQPSFYQRLQQRVTNKLKGKAL